MSEELSIRIMPDNDKRIEARIPWAGGDGPIAAKGIHGYRWNREEKTWSFPLEWDNCVALRAASRDLGVPLVMSKGIREWAAMEKKRREAIPSHHSMELTDLPIVQEHYPEIWKAFCARPFQSVGVRFGMETGRYILADEPGLGKTLQTIAVMIERQVDGPILVVANKSAAKISWPNEIRRWAPEDRIVHFGAETPAAKREGVIRSVFELPGRTWVIMNPAWVQLKVETDDYGNYLYEKGGLKIAKARVPELFNHTWSAIVADESHETLAIDTKNAKKWSQQRQGLGALESEDLRISVSGTPMRGKPTYMFGHLNWLYPEKYTSFWNWANKHFVVTEDGYNGAKEIGTLKNPKAFYKELEPIMLRRLKSEVAADLPPKQYAGEPHPDGDVVGVWLPMEKEQKKLYEDFVTNQSLTDKHGNELSAVGILALLTRMKQLATTAGRVGTRQVKIPVIDEETGEQVRDATDRKVWECDEYGNPLLMDEDYLIPEFPSNKYEWLTEWLMERDLLGKAAKGTGKVIIASQFKQVINLFRQELIQKHSTPSFAITGDTSAKDRIKMQDEFQNNPRSPKLFFLQSIAGGTSLTLDQADDVIILDEMWNPDAQLQIEDRAHRLSRKHNVSIWYLRSLETIEEKIGITVAEREVTVRGIMDGSRGIDIRKKLMGK